MNKIILFIKECLINFFKFKNINNVENINKIIIGKPRISSHGDFYTNIAFLIYKDIDMKLVDLTNEIKDYLLKNYGEHFIDINIIAGFINFSVSNKLFKKIILDVLKLKDTYGKSPKSNILYNLEMISANPTGPLHLGHGRNAFIAESVSKILEYNGHKVIKEYYVNDFGNQINNLALTVYYYYLRFAKKISSDVPLPKICYVGDWYLDLAKDIYKKYGNKFVTDSFDSNGIVDENNNTFFRKTSVEYFLKLIKAQLADFGIKIDHFSYESDFYKNKKIENILTLLEKNNVIYTIDGAVWLSSQKFGDDKDRVLIKSDKTYTYLLPDIASHYDRILRTKANKFIDFFGADHHGYIDRLSIALSLLGFDKEIFNFQIIQMVKVINNDKIQKMSKRSGNVILLKDLLEIFTVSVIKYIFCSKSKTVHLNFDFEKLIQNNENNPVFYAQYASARCSNIIKKFGNSFEKTENFDLLTHAKEKELILAMDSFNKIIQEAANNFAPYIICDYIQKMTKIFHSYYNLVRIIDNNNYQLSAQRLMLVKAFSQVLKNAFDIIGVEFKEKMY